MSTSSSFCEDCVIARKSSLDIRDITGNEIFFGNSIRKIFSTDYGSFRLIVVI